ncbi:MAG: condensation domain-containing protein [Candidatus Saccharibacteria bacterium]
MDNNINIEKVLPILPVQSGMIADSAAGTDGYYIEQICIQLKPSINDKILLSRIKRIVESNEILRTVFDWSEDDAIQVIISGIEPITAIISINSDIELDAILNKERQTLKPINIAPPIRFAIVHNKTIQYLVVTYHHVLLDGPSVNSLLDILCTDGSYSKNSTEQYIKWQNNNASRPQHISTWQGLLDGLMPEDGILPISCEDRGKLAISKIMLDIVFRDKLIKKTKSMSLTPAVCMQVLWGQWLASYFFKNNLLYGLVVSTRINGINDQAIGPYIATIPWLDKLMIGNSFVEVSKKKQEDILAVDIAKHISLRNITQNVSPYAGLFDAILNITTHPVVSKKYYEVINTYENTGYKLSADIIITDNIEILFSSSWLKNNQLNDAIRSFSEYCSMQIEQENIISVDQKYKIHKINHINDKKTIKDIDVLVAQSINIEPKAVDVEMSFIENGGDSINALRLVNLLQARDITCSVGDILRAKSLNNITDKNANNFSIQTQKKNNSKVKYEVDVLNIPFSTQRIIDAYKTGYGQDYHEQTAFKLASDLDVNIMKLALYELGMEIPTLRLKYSEGHINKQILTNKPRISLKNIKRDTTFDDFIKRVSDDDMMHEININHGDLFRVVMQSYKNGYYFFIGFSALVTDGWSFSKLLSRLFEIYGDISKNCHTRYVDVSYIDYCRKYQTDNTHIEQNLPIKKLSYSFDVSQKKYCINKAQTKKIINNCISKNITVNDYLLKQTVSILTVRGFSNLEIYENGRNDFSLYDSVGPYSHLLTKTINNAISNKAYFVFENYPKDDENRLRNNMVENFKENGNWRRTLLPPATILGLSFEMTEDEIIVLISARKGSIISIDDYWRDLINMMIYS